MIGPSTFLPGSNTELDDNTKMQGFDFNCHMNWRQAEDPDLYVTKPPCENDKIYMVTDDDTTGSRRFKAPTNIEPGAGIYASTFGVKSYFRRMYISSPDEPGNAPSIGTDLCENGDAIVKGSITVDLGVCGNRNNNGYDTYISAGTGQTNDECVSTCPPEGILEDGSILQAVPSEDDDDGIVYIQINGDGEDTGATVEVVVDGDGHTTFTVTDKDGTVQDHIKYNDAAAGSSIARKTTSSTTDSTTTATVTTATATTVTVTTPTEAVTENGDISGSTSNDGSSDASIGGTPVADGGNSTTVVIVVVVVLVLIVIIVAVVYVMKAGGNSGGAGAQGVVSFENPMYDTANKQNPAANYAMPQGGGAAASSGYMDVPVGGGGGGGYTEPSYAQQQGGGGGGYMDVAPNANTATGGYMDVSGGGDGGGGGAGYMDVGAGGYGDSDEEDV